MFNNWLSEKIPLIVSSNFYGINALLCQISSYQHIVTLHKLEREVQSDCWALVQAGCSIPQLTWHYALESNLPLVAIQLHWTPSIHDRPRDPPYRDVYLDQL